jgi:hypothetical protein
LLGKRDESEQPCLDFAQIAKSNLRVKTKTSARGRINETKVARDSVAPQPIYPGFDGLGTKHTEVTMMECKCCGADSSDDCCVDCRLLGLDDTDESSEDDFGDMLTHLRTYGGMDDEQE